MITWRRSQVGDRAPADPLVAKLGDRGEAISDLQRRLTSAGFPCGRIDGHFGKLTERAVAGFQVAHGMIGTGATDGALRAALDAGSETIMAINRRQREDWLASRELCMADLC